MTTSELSRENFEVGPWAIHSPMSALGQKRTYAVQQRMSALPPIATEKADIRKSSCLLCPRKRTCAVHEPMSAKGQKRTLAQAQKMKMLLSILVTCAIFSLVYLIFQFGPRRIEHVVEAAVERYVTLKSTPTSSLLLTPPSKPNPVQFCPNERSISFAETAELVWFNPNLSGGAHTWVFNGAEV